MKLHRLCGVALDDRLGRVYRQGRFMGTVSAILLGGIFGGAPFLWYFVGAPWFIWGGCGALALFIVPMIVNDLRAKFRDTNWVLRLQPDGVWINFRSYQDASSTDGLCVVELSYAEISAARKRVDKFTVPSNRSRSTYHSLTSLELQLVHDRTEPLAAALVEHRNRPGVERRYFGISVTSKPSHFPVSLPAPNRLRIAWRGGVGNHVAPSITDALNELTGYVRVEDPTVERSVDWKHLTDEQLDDRILELALAGDKIDAVKLLTVRRGYSTTEAVEFVKGLTASA